MDNTRKPALRFGRMVWLFLFGCGIIPLAAQPAEIARIEGAVKQRNAKIRTLEETLDRRQKLLQTILKQVDALKKTNADQESIQSAMALALSVSQKIEGLQVRIDSLVKKNETDKTELRRFYTGQIDSLRRRIKGENKPEQKDRLQKELLALYDKRLRFMPRFNSIHFDPQTLSPPPQDSLGMILRKDYLSLSLAEIDSQLQEIRSAEQTVIRQQKLASKAEIFLDDINEGLLFRPQDQLTQSNARASGTDGGVDYTGRTEADLNAAQLNNRIVTLNRLYDDLITSGSVSDNPLQRQKMERYLKLLREIREYLLLYRRVITDQLEKAED